MGAQTSQQKRVIRSVSFSQRDVYKEFDVQLFKIDCEVRFTPAPLHPEKISEIKLRLYHLRQDFDSSKMKEKYELEFRQNYRRVMENLERRLQSNVIAKARRKSRKKYIAPSPPSCEQIEDLRSEMRKLQERASTFRGRRDGSQYSRLHQGILALLFTLTTVQVGTDTQKYTLMKELLGTLKLLEERAVENDETAVNCD